MTILLLALLLLSPSFVPDAAAQAAPVPQTPATRAEELNRLVDEVAAEVEKLRGWTFKRPVKRQRTSLEQARRDLQRDLEKAVPTDRRDTVSVFLTTAGFLPAGHDFSKTVLSLLEQQVAGLLRTRNRNAPHRRAARARCPPSSSGWSSRTN